MSLARHCDGPDCDTWQRLDSDLPSHWVTVTEDGRERHYCDPWCCVRDLSRYAEPPTIIDVPGGDL